MKDVPTKSNVEEYALGMGKNWRRNSAASMDAQLMQEKEEYAVNMELSSNNNDA